MRGGTANRYLRAKNQLSFGLSANEIRSGSLCPWVTYLDASDFVSRLGISERWPIEAQAVLKLSLVKASFGTLLLPWPPKCWDAPSPPTPTPSPSHSPPTPPQWLTCFPNAVFVVWSWEVTVGPCFVTQTCYS